MASDGQPKVVTLKSLELPEAASLESMAESRAPGDDLLMARYYQVMERLRQETDTAGSDLMITVPDRDVSRLQSEMARREQAARTLDAGGQEVKFGTGLAGGDWFGWIKSLFDHVDRSVAHPMLRPATADAAPIADTARVAMTADWGTGLYGAPRIAAQMRQQGPFDLLLHLGDVYYSGTEEEVNERFLQPWPKDAGRISRALNSNHEMYSGGFGYFAHALPALGQSSSYFAFQNAEWLLVGLDTAYVDHDLDTQQVAWLNLVIERSAKPGGGKKKLVLFSHQQPFSRLDDQGPKLQLALRHLFDSHAITAWYWGHEHQCVIYDRDPRSGMFGRCLGNGGIPEPRKREVIDAPAEHTVGQMSWKRLGATAESPSCLVLDGPNPDVKGQESKFVPHGFMTLEFSGATMTERVFAADGTLLLTNALS